MLSQLAVAETITVPGALICLSLYFWLIDSESFPVGTLTPKLIAKLDKDSTASNSLESSPLFLHGHIQFAERETPSIPSLRGAHIILVSASATLFILPALELIRPEIGEWPIEVATPKLDK